MRDCNQLKGFFYKRVITVINVCIALIFANNLSAATLKLSKDSVVLMAGQTIEVPLYSDKPISGDLTARGMFQSGDVSFTPGPGCRLSSHDCTLLITTAPSSQDYTSVPVIVSESGSSNKPVFFLSVIRSKDPTLLRTKLPEIASIPQKMIAQKPVVAPSSKPGTILTAGNLSATIIPHTIGGTFYTSSSNGPVYQMIQVTNNGGSAVTLDTPAISGAGASSFRIDTSSSDYAGTPIFCNNAPTLANGESCEMIITSTLGDPASAPVTATLTITDGIGADTLTFSLIDTTYVYAGGGFHTLGNASVAGGDLLAQCTAGTCSNALQGNSGNNYASTNSSVGQWINALIVMPNGNLIVGGVFGAIGGATSGASSGTRALLAQCIPGAVTGNACFNQISINSTLNPYTFENAYIDAISSVLTDPTKYILVGGDFNKIRGLSATTGGRILAKCIYTNANANPSCFHYMTAAKVANGAIAALNTMGSILNTPQVNTGGLFTQIAGYPGSPASTGTTFASCTQGSLGSCSKGMEANNPNNSILGMSDDGTNLYMGGTFTKIGGYTDISGGYPLVKCTLNTTTTCVNALAGSNDANGYIEGLVYSGGNLYVGGNFTTIGGATPVSGGNMLAVCTPGGTCSNFVTDALPYAIGTDWGGGIFALGVGNQTSIVVN